MVGSISVNMTGFAALNQRMQQLSADVATKLGQQANRSGATVLRKEIAKEAPNSSRTTEGEARVRKNKSGTTRTEQHRKIVNWVRVKKTKSDATTKVQNTVGILAYTAAFVEFGSIHNAPNPFFQRAMQSSEQKIIDAMAKTLDRGLTRRGA